MAKPLFGRGMTIKENNRYQRHKRQMIIDNEKRKRGACLDCGLSVAEKPLCCFDFDHRDPDTKALPKFANNAPQRIIDELAKCDLVCAICHRIRTQKQFDAGLFLFGNTKTNVLHDDHPTLFDDECLQD